MLGGDPGTPWSVDVDPERGLVPDAAIGIFVAGTLLDSQTMMIPSLIYAVVMNVTTMAVLVLVWTDRHRARRAAGGPAQP